MSESELVEQVEALEINSDDEDLPDELKDLVQSAMGQDEPKEAVDSPRTEVQFQDLIDFFKTAKTELSDSSFVEKVRKVVEKIPKSEGGEARMASIRSEIESQYLKIWKRLGVEPNLGKHAVIGLEKTLSDENIGVDYRIDLREKVNEFSEVEQSVVGRVLLGEEVFKSRQEQQKKVLARKEELMKELTPLSKEERGKLVMDLKGKALEIRTKLMAMGQKKAASYLTNLNEEETKIMDSLSALAILIQENSSLVGISHGCCNHGKCEHEK